jgi:peptidoglycan/LPS O-acetylase OafA/YrhL
MQKASTGGSSDRRHRYRPEIDGLRAVAIVPVILFHAGIASFRGGFVGVDVFFVISGFLITRIIIADLEAGSFSITRFYERRARRILPALFLVLAACSVFAWVWMVPSQLRLFARSLVAVSLFGSNVLLARTTGYFADAAEENPLLHTWSLAVEEQYYLLFPVLLPWAWRRGGMRWATWMVGLLGCASLVLAVWGARSYPRENFFLTPPRAWELMIGALLALLSRRRPFTDYVGRAGRQGLAMVGLGLIGAAIALFDEGNPFPSEHALVPTLGAALVIAFGERSTLVGRVLSHSWVVGVGLVSYSAYLWHQPLFAFARIVTLDRVSTPAMLLLALVSLPLAVLTWHYVETPFRAPGLVSRPTVFR